MMDSDDDLLNDMMDQIEEGESQEEDWMDTGWAQPVSASHTAAARSIYESTESTSKVVQTTAEAKSSSDTGDSTVVQRMLLNDNKAGMDGLDKQKINQIIHEASKGSKFYENERNKEEQMKKRIAVQKQKIENISAAQLQQGLFEADRLLEDFEQQRDLTHTIVHIDMDAFYAAVEMRDKPSLKNKPMAVGSNSMLSTSNYHARKFGVRAAMPGFIGKKLCPDLVIMPLSFDKYTEVSKQVKSLIAEYDANFCPMSLDEAYLDITDHLERRKEMTESERTCICRDRNYTDSTSHCLCDLNEVVRRYGSNSVFCDINCDKKDENKEVVSTEDKSNLDLHAHFMNGSITANPDVKSDTSGDILLKSDEALEPLTELDKRSDDHCIKKMKRDLLCPFCGREFPPFTLLTFGLSDEDAVNELRMRIEQRTRLTASAGIAPNMMLAKVCSDKNKPNGQFKIHATRQDVMTFIKDLPTRKISGIGKVSEAMLNAMGVYTCTDLYEERALLYQLYSPISFNYFMRICLGIGSTTVERDSERKSISTERTFSEIYKPTDLFRKCEELSESLANDLKEEELKGKTVSIKIKTVKFEVKTRAHTLRDYTNDKDVILQAALELLKTEIQLCAPQPLRLRLMGVRMSSLLHQKLCKDKRQNTILGAFKKLAEKIPKSDNVDEHVSNTNDDIKLSNIHFKAKADADTLTQSVDDVTKFSVGFGIPNSVMQGKPTFTEENSLGSSTTVYTTASEDVHDVAADEKKGSLENMNIPVTIKMPKPVPVNEFIPEEVIEENKLLDNLSVDFRIQEPINDFFTDCSQISDPSFDDESRCKKLKTINEPETALVPSDVQSNSCMTSIQIINCDTSNSVDNTCLDNARKEIEDQNEIIQYEEETGSSIRSSKIDENFELNCKSTDDVNLPPRQNIKESANATGIVHVGTEGTRKNRSGLVRTPNRRPTKRRRNSKRQEEISYLCPVCSRNILCSSLNDFNEHVDDCLENDNKEVTEEILDESKEIKGVHNLLSKEDIVDNSNFVNARKQGLPLNLDETQTSSENSVENVNMFENCSRVQSEGSFIKISCENTKVNLTVESSGSETNPNIDIEVSGQESDTFDHNQIGFNANNTENEIFDPDNVECNENTFNVIKKEEASSETIANKSTYMKHIIENSELLDDSLELDVSRDAVVKLATVGNNIGVESKICTYKRKIHAGEKIIETCASVESNETDKTNLQFDRMKLPSFNESKLLSLDIMKLSSLDKMKPLSLDELKLPSLDEVKLPSMEMSDCQSPSCSSTITCKQFEIVDINCNIKSGEHVPLKPVTIVSNDSDGDPYSLIASSNDNAASTENKCDKNSLVSTGTRSDGSNCESTIQAEISIQDNSSDKIVEFHQGVAIETSEVEDDTDNGSDEDAGGLLVCPICNTEQRSASLTEFNSHVDACLSRGTISEILREQRQVEKSTKKRVNSSRNTPGSSQKSMHRKTMLPEKTPSCRSIASFFTLK